MKVQTLQTDKLVEYPNNARIGDVNALADSLTTNGQYRPIVVQKSTNYVLAGNHLLKAALKLGWTEIDAVIVDVDDIAAKKIVLSDNRTAELGGYNEEALAELLASLTDFDGTGYSLDDLDDLIAGVEEAEAENETAEQKYNLPTTESNNITHIKSIAERAAAYESMTRRQIIMQFSNANFVWAVEQMTAIRNTHGFEDNSQLLAHWITQETQVAAPEAL